MSKPPFEQVVREHGPTVLRVCRAVLGYHEAEDAWSETFLAAMREDNDGELAAALQLLPLRQREAIAYHYLAGLPYREVAEILGNSEAAARRSASDGMQKLRLHYRRSSPQVVHHNVQ